MTEWALARAMLEPGDVVAVRGGGFAGQAIRFGAGLIGLPNLSGHIAGFHHWDDKTDIPWGLEGRPGGVGWVDMRPYLRSPWTINNCGQPGRNPGGLGTDRVRAAKLMESMQGTKYDWEAIGGDGLRDLHVKLWTDQAFNPHPGKAPGEVVCSSYFAYVYMMMAWLHPSPGTERVCEPGDWDEFILAGGYSRALR